MCLVTILPYLTGMSGMVYLVSALVLGAGFLYYSLQLMFTDKPRAALTTFRYSILYLIVLFIALLVDHYL